MVILIKIKRNSSNIMGYFHLVKLDLRRRHFDNTPVLFIRAWNLAHHNLASGVNC